jgi:protein-disulfide isomerase
VCLSLRPIRFVSLILVIWGTFLVGRVLPPSELPEAGEADARKRILNYLREKYGISDSVEMTVRPLHKFSNPDFYRTSITLEKVSSQRSQHLFLTRDCRYLIVGEAYPLGPDTQAEISQRVREIAKLPAGGQVTVGPLRASKIPRLLLTRVTAQDGDQKRIQDLYVTEDRKILFVGEVYDLTSDPREEVLRTISVEDCPSVGPADAPVTIVEFSDLQCTSCARFDEFLREELVPKYGGKVRVVFKEFPLARIHDWTLTGSIVAQCAYVLAPSAYVRLRALIYQNQHRLDARHARDRLLSLGEQAGLNRQQLAACVDSKSTLPRIRRDLAEGVAVGVHSTPTTFINGRMVLGMSSRADYYRVVDDALRAVK